VDLNSDKCDQEKYYYLVNNFWLFFALRKEWGKFVFSIREREELSMPLNEFDFVCTHTKGEKQKI